VPAWALDDGDAEPVCPPAFQPDTPPAPGQLGRWFDRRQLRDLLELEFEVLELFSVTPRANRGIMRLVNSKTIRATVGDRIEKLKEAVGLC